MAEDLERRSKQKKSIELAVNPKITGENGSETDLLGQSGKKKGRLTKGSMTTTSTSAMLPTQTTTAVSGASSTSKTVAAILKQAKDQHKSSKEHLQQNPAARKRTKPGSATVVMGDQGITSSQLLNQLSMKSSIGSSQSFQENSLRGKLSPALSSAISSSAPTGSPRGISPLGKDKGPPATTKASSLSRELSPSRITAQMVKAMAETTSTTVSTSTTLAPNLLRSALQGNMPDPMGMLSASKQESTPVPSIPLSSFQSSSSSSSSSTSSLSSTDTVLYGGYNNSPNTGISLNPAQSINNGNNVSTPTSQLQKQQQHSSNKLLTGLQGSTDFDVSNHISANSDSLQQAQGQQFQIMIPPDYNMEDLPSPQTAMPTVENLLAASAGNIQTVNVSHIPKSISSVLSSSGSPGSTSHQHHGSGASAPIRQPSSRSSAMEIAQQIKLEANGQKSSAALKPGMQKQLRTQIQSSCSIDAQLTSSGGGVGSGAVGSVGPTKLRNAGLSQSAGVKKTSAKEGEQYKSLEASMPLLAAKLAPGSANLAAAKVNTSAASLSQARGPQSLSTNVNPSTTPDQTKKLLSQGQHISSSPSSTSSLSYVNQKQQRQQVYHPHQVTKQQPHQQQGFNAIQHQSQQSQLVSGNMGEVKISKDNWAMQQSSQNQHVRVTNTGPKTQSQKQPQPLPTPLNLSGGLGELLSGLDKQQVLERLFQASINSSLAERAAQLHQGSQQDDLYHNLNLQQLLAAPTTASDSLQKSGASLSSLIMAATSSSSSSSSSSTSQVSPAMQALFDRLTQEFPNHSIKGLLPSAITVSTTSNSSSFSSTGSVSHPGHSAQLNSALGQGSTQQTAIDVDIDSDVCQVNPVVNNETLAQHRLLPSSQTVQFSSVSNMPKQQASYISNSLKQPTHIVSSSVLSSISSSPSLSSQITSVSSTTAGISRAQPIVTNYTAPPPYPAKHNHLNQQTQQQQQRPNSKSSPGSATSSASGPKQVAENPFTFPTTGVTIHPDLLSSYPLTAPSVNNHNGTAGSKPAVFNNRNNNINNGAPIASVSQVTLPNNISVQKQTGHFREPMTVGSTNQLLAGPPADSGCQKGNINSRPNSFTNGVLKKSESSALDSKELTDTKAKEESLVPLSVQPFNQRISNLSCFPVINPSYRAAYRSHSVAVQRARSGVITNIAKSLDILRQNLQRSINKEISEIINRYSDKYFQPALENIRHNNNNDFVGTEHLNYVCRQILEEAKSEYMPEIGRRSVTPSDLADNVSESGSISGRRVGLHLLKRGRISDSDSEKGSDGGFKRKVPKKKGRPVFHSSGRVTPSKTYKSGDPVKREGPKWDPARLKSDTLFVMGARANKALGLGNTRGRLYIRHPDVFKYIGDADDKSWLYDHNLMPATGGKAYMLLLEDIEDLSKTDEYKDSPGLMMHECVGFTVPEWMLVKMKEQMNNLRSDGHKANASVPSPVAVEVETKPKILPFSAFTTGVLKEEQLVSPANTEEMEFLSTVDNDDTQPSSVISPFNVTASFEEGAVSPSPSDLESADAGYPNFLLD